MWVCLYEGGEWGGGRGWGDQTHTRSAVKVTLQNVMLLGDVCFCFSVNIFIQTLSKSVYPAANMGNMAMRHQQFIIRNLSWTV